MKQSILTDRQADISIQGDKGMPKKKKGTKVKSKKQVGFLLSDKVSPLTAKQKEKLKRELHSGKVKVKGGKKSRGKK